MSGTIDPPSSDARHADNGIEREKRSATAYRRKDVPPPVTIHIRREQAWNGVAVLLNLVQYCNYLLLGRVYKRNLHRSRMP